MLDTELAIRRTPCGRLLLPEIFSNTVLFSPDGKWFIEITILAISWRASVTS